MFSRRHQSQERERLAKKKRNEDKRNEEKPAYQQQARQPLVSIQPRGQYPS